MENENDFRKTQLNRFARFGLWNGVVNGESCFLLVVDDIDDDDDEDSNFKSVIQLSNWDGRPGMSARVFDAGDVLCAEAEWLGEATLRLTRRFEADLPPTHVGQVYVYNQKPHLLVLDDLARLREHDLVGIFHHGAHEGDGYYEWELTYRSGSICPHDVVVSRSAEIDSWINDWTPPAEATALSCLPRS